jgi:hypothetical protein
MVRAARALGLGVLIGAACTGPAAPLPTPAAASSRGLLAPSAPLPAASPGPAASSAAPVEIAAAPRWFVVAAAREPFGRPRFFHEASAVFGGAHDYQLRKGTWVEVELGTLADETLPAPSFSLVRGSFPDQCWMAEELVGPGDGRGTTLFHFTPRGWAKVKTFDEATLPRYAGVALGPEGRVSTVVVGKKGAAEILLLQGKATPKLPRLTLGEGDRVLGFTGLVRGDLYLASLARSGHAFVDHWPPSAEQARRYDLGEGLGSGPPQNRARLLVAKSEREVYVAGGSDPAVGGAPFLARFDGAAWSRLELPGRGALQSYDVSPEGEIWIVQDGPPSSKAPGESHRELWVLPAGSAVFERVPLGPVLLEGEARPSPYDVFAPGSGEVVVLADLHFQGGARKVAMLSRTEPRARLDL